MTTQATPQTSIDTVTDVGFYTQVCLSVDGLVIHLLPDGSILKVPVSRYKDLLAMGTMPRPSPLPGLVGKVASALAWCLRVGVLLAARHGAAG